MVESVNQSFHSPGLAGGNDVGNIIGWSLCSSKLLRFHILPTMFFFCIYMIKIKWFGFCLARFLSLYPWVQILKCQISKLSLYLFVNISKLLKLRTTLIIRLHIECMHFNNEPWNCARNASVLNRPLFSAFHILTSSLLWAKRHLSVHGIPGKVGHSLILLCRQNDHGHLTLVQAPDVFFCRTRNRFFSHSWFSFTLDQLVPLGETHLGQQSL